MSKRPRSSQERPSILVVGTGARGGIGRYEQLLRRALDELESEGAFAFRHISRRQHPAYLSGGSAAGLATQTETSMARYVSEIGRAAVAAKPDLVLYLHYRLARVAPMTRALGAKRYAVVAYGDEIWFPVDRLGRRVLRGADRLLAISEHTAAELARLQGTHRARTSITPLSLDPEWLGRTQPRHGTAPVGTDFKLLTVSRLESAARYKGIDDVIRALPAVLQAHPGLEYHVVGDGDDRPYLEDLARREGVNESVVFHGFVDDAALTQAYADADGFVLTSTDEGFGLVFLEAMAYGLPVVARRAAAAPEVVADGKTGYLVDGPADISSRLLALFESDERRRDMGSAGRLRATDEFTFDGFKESTRVGLSAALA